ncbi:unnamed protein product, partial [Prorocentrum cordatum]
GSYHRGPPDERLRRPCRRHPAHRTGRPRTGWHCAQGRSAGGAAGGHRRPPRVPQHPQHRRL